MDIKFHTGYHTQLLLYVPGNSFLLTSRTLSQKTPFCECDSVTWVGGDAGIICSTFEPQQFILCRFVYSDWHHLYQTDNSTERPPSSGPLSCCILEFSKHYIGMHLKVLCKDIFAQCFTIYSRESSLD